MEVEFQHVRKPKPNVKRRLPQRRCQSVERLFGPIELDILDNKETGARVVLLGDVHVSQRKCPPNAKCGVPIWTYLENLFRTYQGSEKIDFFMEIAFIDEEEEEFPILSAKRAAEHKLEIQATQAPHHDYIGAVHAFFYNCWQRSKIHCPFRQKIRFHYSDVRSGVIHSSSDLEDRSMVKHIRELLAIHNVDVGLKHKNILRNLIDKFLQSDVTYFFRLTKIDKQLKALNRELSYELHQWMLKHMEIGREFAKYVKLTLEEMVQTKLAIIVKNETNERLFVLVQTGFFGLPHMLKFTELAMFTIGALLTPLFDIYTVARMIRLNMKQVIIFAGLMHTERIRSFLIRNMGFKRVVGATSRKQDRDFQCVSLKNIPQPWF